MQSDDRLVVVIYFSIACILKTLQSQSVTKYNNSAWVCLGYTGTKRLTANLVCQYLPIVLYDYKLSLMLNILIVSY